MASVHLELIMKAIADIHMTWIAYEYSRTELMKD